MSSWKYLAETEAILGEPLKSKPSQALIAEVCVYVEHACGQEEVPSFLDKSQWSVAILQKSSREGGR